MKVLIKYHEKTPEKDQYFILDSSKHYQIIPIQDNIEYYNNPSSIPQPTPIHYSNVRIDLTKYDGRKLYGIFHRYSRIDGLSIFEVDEHDMLKVNRDYKLNQLLQ